MKWKDFLPAADERIFICGTTGSGKSVFTRHLLDQIPKKKLVVILDDKHDWPISKSGPFLLKRERIKYLPLIPLKEKHYVFRPDYPEMSDEKLLKLLYYLFERGDCTIVFDEVGDYSKGSYVWPILGKLIRQGRSKKIRLFMGNQRPAAIPRIVLSEASKVACFDLELEDDRKRMSRDVHPLLMQEAPEHDFYWYDRKKKSIGAILVKQTKEEGREA